MLHVQGGRSELGSGLAAARRDELARRGRPQKLTSDSKTNNSDLNPPPAEVLAHHAPHVLVSHTKLRSGRNRNGDADLCSALSTA